MNKRQVVGFCLVFVFLFTVMLALKSTQSELYNTAYSVYSPLEELYDQNSGAVFTSIFNNKDITLIVPVSGYDYSIEDGIISFSTNSLMLKSPAEGIIGEISTNAKNQKCLVIHHSNTMYTYFENVDILGVKTGDRVAQNKVIATLKRNEQLKLSVWCNGTQIKNISISNNKIEWIS